MIEDFEPMSMPAGSTNLDSSLDPTVIREALSAERLYAFIGLLVGGLVIGAGIAMIFSMSQAKWT